MNATDHGLVRAKQRGIPPLIVQWLEDFGRETHDGHGARILWFDKHARRRVERAAGREPVRRMHEWMSSYVVVGETGKIITTGKRFKRIRV